MRLLLDTHAILAYVAETADTLPPAMRHAIDDPGSDCTCSVVSMWEIAIKHRLGKLRLAVSLTDVPAIVERMGFDILEIDHRHVLAELKPEPPTRDPFDRLLLAQCQIEDMRLVTLDRALVDHPLAFR